jgi:hypothetical protein
MNLVKLTASHVAISRRRNVVVLAHDVRRRQDVETGIDDVVEADTLRVIHTN